MGIFWNSVSYKQRTVNYARGRSMELMFKTVTYWLLIIPIYSKTTTSEYSYV